MPKEYRLTDIEIKGFNGQRNGLISYRIEFREDPRKKPKEVYFWLDFPFGLKRAIAPELKDSHEIQLIVWTIILPWIEEKLAEGVSEESIKYPHNLDPKNLTEFDIYTLSQPFNEWIPLLEKSERKMVFISCGQRTLEEKQLGQDIMVLVRKITPFEPYFADFQSSLQGVTQNIFAKLNEAVGLISVMHQRGDVTAGEEKFTRASVWVEQEIAIASFIEHTLGTPFHVAAFSEKGVKLEGVRKYIILNPFTFQANEEVLEKLRKILPGWSPPAGTNKGPKIEAEIEYETIKRTQDHHDYQLKIFLNNKGQTKIDDFRVDLLIPKGILNPKTVFAPELPDKQTSTHRFFRITNKEHRNLVFYPGDRELVLKIAYFVNSKVFHSPQIMKEYIRATVYSDNMASQTTEKKVSELNEF